MNNIHIFLAQSSNYFCIVKVVGEFKSLRTLINDNFKKLSDHLQQNQQTESLHQRKEPIGRRDDGIDTDVRDNVGVYRS